MKISRFILLLNVLCILLKGMQICFRVDLLGSFSTSSTVAKEANVTWWWWLAIQTLPLLEEGMDDSDKMVSEEETEDHSKESGVSSTVGKDSSSMAMTTNLCFKKATKKAAARALMTTKEIKAKLGDMAKREEGLAVVVVVVAIIDLSTISFLDNGNGGERNGSGSLKDVDGNSDRSDIEWKGSHDDC